MAGSSSDVRAPAVAGSSSDDRALQDRYTNLHPWHVAAPEDDDLALIVAARSSRATSVDVLQVTKMFHREYTKNRRTHMTYSRLLCAAVKWEKAIHGCGVMTVLNVHFHHLVAKKDPHLRSSTVWAISLVILCVHVFGLYFCVVFNVWSLLFGLYFLVFIFVLSLTFGLCFRFCL